MYGSDANAFVFTRGATVLCMAVRFVINVTGMVTV